MVLLSAFSCFAPFVKAEEEEKKLSATPMADRLRYSDEEIEDKKEDESGENIILNKTIKAIYRAYDTEEVSVKIGGKNKSYMDYRSITATGSTQYKYIRKYMTVDDTTGLLFDEEGFIGAALGAYFGEIGEKYLFTLTSGVVLDLLLLCFLGRNQVVLSGFTGIQPQQLYQLHLEVLSERTDCLPTGVRADQ